VIVLAPVANPAVDRDRPRMLQRITLSARATVSIFHRFSAVQ